MAKAKSKSPPAARASDSPALSFEGALEQLETTVARLESGEMPLEEALELFEAGVKLSRQCNETLEAAERRIEILVADRVRSGDEEGWDEEEFDSGEESEDFED